MTVYPLIIFVQVSQVSVFFSQCQSSCGVSFVLLVGSLSIFQYCPLYLVFPNPDYLQVCCRSQPSCNRSSLRLLFLILLPYIYSHHVHVFSWCGSIFDSFYEKDFPLQLVKSLINQWAKYLEASNK